MDGAPARELLVEQQANEQTQIEQRRELNPASSRKSARAENNRNMGKSQINMQIQVEAEGLKEAWEKNDLVKLREHLISLRKLFSKETNLPDGLVEQSKVGPDLIEIINKYRIIDSEIVFESLWAITNIIASGHWQDTNCVINLGALTILGDLLDHPSDDIVEKATCCLSNMAFCGPTWRSELVINLRINDHLSRLLTENTKLTIRRNVSLLLRSICRRHDVSLINIALPYIQRHSVEDDEVLCNLLWAVYTTSFHAEDDGSMNAVLDSGVILPFFSVALGECSTDHVLPVLKTIDILINRCNAEQTQVIVQQGAFRILRKYFLQEARMTYNMIGVCCSLCSFAEKGPDQIQMILDDEELVTSVCTKILSSMPRVSPYVESLACTILSPMCQYGTKDQVRKLVTIPLVVRALLLATMHRNITVRETGRFVLGNIIRRVGCLACCQSIKTNDPVERIEDILDRHPLERLLRDFEGPSEVADLAALLVAYGCSPSAKVHGTNITLAKYALCVNLPTGIRLNQLSVLTVLLGPIYFQRFLPKHGMWLPRDLWMLLFERYFQYVGENDVQLWFAKANYSKTRTIKKLRNYTDDLVRSPKRSGPSCCTVN